MGRIDMACGAKSKKIVNLLQDLHSKVDNLEEKFDSDCPNGWTYYGERCYKAFFEETFINWRDAQKSCRMEGGDLVVIHSPDLNVFVNNLAGSQRAWIGAFRIGPVAHNNNEFSWTDGSNIDFDNWSAGQPDNADSVEFCVHLNLEEPAGSWNDIDCRSPDNQIQIRSFVCQI